MTHQIARFNDASDREITVIRMVIDRYALHEIYNADEFGHFFYMAPDHSIARNALAWRKSQKVRLTYLSWCNETRTYVEYKNTEVGQT